MPTFTPNVQWILEALPVGVWVGEVPSGRVVYANPEFQNIVGVDVVSDLVIEDAPATYGVFDPEGRLYAVDRLPFSRVVATGESVVTDDLVVHRPDGRHISIRAFAYPLRSEGGQLTHVVVAFVDITSEMRAKADRRLTQSRLTLAVEHAPIVIWSATNDGVVTMSHGAGLESLGVKSGELVGQNLFDLYKDHPSIPGALRRALSGESFHYTVQVGEAVYETWVTPLTDGGRVTGIVGVSHDVSALRKLQATAIQNDRVIALGTLAASVAHEINNPLTYMLGHIDLLSSTLSEIDRVTDGLPAPSRPELAALVGEVRDSLELVRDGTQRIDGITKELRTFSRPAAQASPVDVRSAVTSVLRLVGKELESRARLEVSLADTRLVRADIPRLVQVVMNLVVNAVQVLPANRHATNRIWVRTADDGGDVVIEIADNGPGVAEEDRERIFEPFLTTKAVGEGSGLGLFVCRNIVSTWAGTVRVDERPGGGARFRVVLPAVPVGEVTLFGAAALGGKRSSATAQLMIIDDEPPVAGVMRAQLERAGYQVIVETDAQRGLDRLLAGSGGIDLIYCDLMMRGLSGMDLADALAARAPEYLPRVVFMTGGAFTPRARDFRSAHTDRCVDKPFDIVAETARRLADAHSG